MKKGRYAKKTSSRGLFWILAVLLLIILLSVIAIVIMLTRPKDQGKVPQTQPMETIQTLPQTQPPTEEPTWEPTAPPTEPPTKAPTAPPTEPPTESPTEPPTEPPAEKPTKPLSNQGEQIAELAKTTLGAPFEMGGNGPDTFDTSGLVYYCFREFDISVPRTVSSQATYGQEVAKEDILPGDVVFFWLDTEGEAQYVGIYIGNDTFIAARNSEYPVSERDFDSSYFTERFVCARRYWE